MVIINKKFQTDEIRKCARDPIYFFRNYVKISHPIKGPIPFKTYDFQDECVKAFQTERFIIINKARQLGMSTLAAAYAAWMLIFRRNKEIVVMATKLDTACNFVRKVKQTIVSVPKWLVLPKVIKNNEQKLIFGKPSNSRIAAISTSSDAGRSEALSLLIIDEAAHVDNFEELWTGLYPTLSTGGRAMLISTPKGVGNWFHKLWQDAKAGVESGKGVRFKPIELYWDIHPDRDQAWFDEMTANMNERQIAQEYKCDFLASGDTYLDADDIRWVGEMVRPPLRQDGPERNVWIWQEPIRDKEVKYIIPADVGRGDASDFSTFHVICITTGEVVAEYKGKIRPDLFAELLAEYGKRYNNALLVPERNTYGHHTIVHLITQLGYTHIYFKDRNGAYIGDYIPPEKISDAGFDTQKGSRAKIVSKLEEIIRNRQIKVYSERLHEELKTFITKGDKPQAQKNCHDDLVMALAIGMYLFDVDDVHGQFATELNSAMLSGFGMTSNDYADMEGNGNEVLPSWTGMVPYSGGPVNAFEPNARRRRPLHDDPANLDWLFQ